MKKLLLAFFTFTCLIANAQINVGSKTAPAIRAGKFSDEDLAELKKTTTLFTLQSKDYDQQQDFEKAIADVWTVTKFKIIKPEEVKKYELLEGYSFFTFGGYYTGHTGRDKMPIYTIHMTYDLSIPEVGKKGKVKDHQYFTRMLLSLDEAGMNASGTSGRKRPEKELSNLMHNKLKFYNWGAGYLKGQLITVNKLLMAGETRVHIKGDEQIDILKGLKNDTLYIPDYINNKYSVFTGKSKEKDKDENEGALKEFYSFPMKIVSGEEINDMIINRSTPVYYLVFVRSSVAKYINVYHSTKGMIYSQHQLQSYNFKPRDLTIVESLLK